MQDGSSCGRAPLLPDWPIVEDTRPHLRSRWGIFPAFHIY